MTAVINEPIVTTPVADLDVTTTQTELLAALNYISKATKTSKTTQLMVLRGALLEAGNGQLTIARFDYETLARQTIAGIGSGRALIASHVLLSFVKSMTKGCPITIRVEGKVAVVDGDDVVYRIPLLPIEDYPELPPASGEPVAEFTPEVLAQLTAVTGAAGRDDTLPVLTGVCFSTAGGDLELAATDRYRLAVLDTGAKSELAKPVLVPAAAVKYIAGAFKGETVTISYRPMGKEDGHVIFAAGRRELTVRVVSGTFPDYRRLLPSAVCLPLTVNIAALVKGVTQVALAAYRTAPVRMSTSVTEVVLQAGTENDVTARKAVPADGNQVPIETAFNPGYLNDGVAAIGGDTVRISFASEDPFEAGRKPIIMTRPDDARFRYLLMPVRLNG